MEYKYCIVLIAFFVLVNPTDAWMKMIAPRNVLKSSFDFADSSKPERPIVADEFKSMSDSRIVSLTWIRSTQIRFYVVIQ
mgnify:CR=1 FL=1